MSSNGETVPTFVQHSEPKGTTTNPAKFGRTLGWTWRLQAPKNISPVHDFQSSLSQTKQKRDYFCFKFWSRTFATKSDCVTTIHCLESSCGMTGPRKEHTPSLQQKQHQHWRIQNGRQRCYKTFYCLWQPIKAGLYFCKGVQTTKLASIEWEKKLVECLRSFGMEMSRCVQNINRWKQRGSDDNGYFIVGERPNRKGSGIRPYRCKPNITDEEINSLRCVAGGIIKDLETTTLPFTQHLQLEDSVISQAREGSNLNTVGKYATAFSVGILYHSKCHIDKDFFFSLLTVTAPSQRHDGNRSITLFFLNIELKFL